MVRNSLNNCSTWTSKSGHHWHAKDVTGIEFTDLEDHTERFRNEVLHINDSRSAHP